MNPWAKTAIVAVATALGSAAFVALFLHPDALGGALLAFAFFPTVGIQAVAITAAWIWHRRLSKKKDRFFTSAAFGAFVACLLALVLARVCFSDWRAIVRFMYPLPILFCGVPLVYLCFCRPKNLKS